MSVPLFPPLKWAQRQDLVLLTVELQDSRDVKLLLPKDGAALSFTCNVPDVEAGGDAMKHYACEFDFFKPVSPEESDFVVRPRQIEVKLKKKDDTGAEDEGAFWPRLTKDKVKNKNITIDWARWKDEDDIEDDGAMDLGDFGLGGSDDDPDFTQKMLQQFAVNQGKIGAEEAGGQAIPDFGSAQGQEASADAEDDDDEDMPPLEEDH